MAQARTTAKSSRSDDAGEARIASGTRVRGRITGDGDLTIDGEVEGDITLRGVLTIGDGAQVTSNVEAESVSISGALEGDVNATGPVRVGAGSRVRGNLRGSAVAVEEGAEFAGRLECDFELPAELNEPSKNSHGKNR